MISPMTNLDWHRLIRAGFWYAINNPPASKSNHKRKPVVKYGLRARLAREFLDAGGDNHDLRAIERIAEKNGVDLESFRDALNNERAIRGLASDRSGPQKKRRKVA